MRIYRLGEIIWYYTRTLKKSTGDLLTLNTIRAKFWTNVLEAQLREEELIPSILQEYKASRDSLRSEDEKKRQVNLH